MTLSDQTWDLLVVGGGTAGIVGAKTAAGLGAKVALVERARTGGDCLWTGCVPSKSLLAAAAAAAQARRSHELGVTASDVIVDFAAVLRHVRRAIDTIERGDSPESLRAAGVEVLSADARFTSPRTIRADGRTLLFHQALLATGATPAIPDVPGLRQAKPLTSDTVWDLQDLPRRLLVMGGCSIGCELGQAFARLGSQVTLVEVAPRILGNEDPEAAALVHAALAREGVRVLTGNRVVEVIGGPNQGGHAVLESAGSQQKVPYDVLLVAVGRRPQTAGLGLSSAGIDVDDRGMVQVDDTLRTTNRRIWAAGDLTGHPQFTHVAGVHGSLAASNAVLGLRRKVSVDAIPRVTFTDPEVAAVGAASWAEGGHRLRTVTRSHHHVDRAVAEDRQDGFARLVLDARHRVVGATVVGPRAGESLAELTLAVRQRLKTSKVAGTIHAYPTYGDGPWLAALDDVQARLDAPAARLATRLLTLARRAWLSLRSDDLDDLTAG